MITARGKVKVLDFGLAKPVRLPERASASRSRNAALSASDSSHEKLTEPGVLMGTVSYMSPEQASGSDEVTHLSDIFSLGIVLYETVTGKLPFQGETYFQTIEAITKRAPHSIKKHRKDAPPGLISLIERMMKKSAAQRFNSASEVERKLAELTITT